MKLFVKIISGILVVCILVIVSLSFYFNDERLREMVVPAAIESVGTEIQVENMSLSFLRAFPDIGVSMQGLRVPDQNDEPIAELEELLVSVKILPLIGGNVFLSELNLSSPKIYYKIREDSTTNLDFLLVEDEASTEEETSGFSLEIPQMVISNGSLVYRDLTTNTEIIATDLNSELALRYADLIHTDLTANLGSLSVSSGGQKLLENMSFELNQSSALDMTNEQLDIQSGSLAIRGLNLSLAGNINSWSSEELGVNISMSTSSNDFGELLKLLPPEYDETLQGLETRGALAIDGSIKGVYSEQKIPDFSFDISVENGYLKNPDLPNAIEGIQLSFLADNEQISIQNFEAKADGNTVNVSGSILDPLEENISYDLLINGDIDLATIERFYPIRDFDIQELSGTLTTDINARGDIDSPENAELDGSIVLRNGLVRYVGVEQAIENIQVDINAASDRMNIRQLSLKAVENTMSFSGSVINPLNPSLSTVNLTGNLNFDLSTIKNFYPIDEDTLDIRGQLTSQINLRGPIEPLDIQNILKNSTVSLSNGYLAHSSIGQPLRDVNFSGTVSGTSININQAAFKTGNNSLSVKGRIQDYLSEEPIFDVNLNGDAKLGDIASYYSLEPWIQELSGDMAMNVSASGPAGDPLQLKLNGNLNVSGVNASGDSLLLPVRDVSGQLSVTPERMQLSDYSMNFGSSDIRLEGTMRNYLGFLKENPSSDEIPIITGTYASNLLTIDEMIDWDEETDPNEPFPIELPDMRASVSAQIDQLVIFGINLTKVSGNGEMSPVNLRLNEATATMFEGTATGSMNWEIPEPTNTQITFNGNLEQLKAKSFFRDTGFLGPESTIHNYIEGAFSANVSYSSELNPALSPMVSTTEAEGSFGMSKARLKGHPIQLEVARLFKIKELENIALDEWQSDFSISNEILTFKNLNLTSGNIGLEMEGTHHMVTDSVNYKAEIALPERFKSGISSVIGERAANALQQENGTIAVPLLITGTSQKPRVRPDQNVIKKIVEDYLKKRGGNLLRNLIDGNQ